MFKEALECVLVRKGSVDYEHIDKKYIIIPYECVPVV